MKKIDFRQRAAKTEERKRKSKYADVMVRRGWVLLHNPQQGIAIPTRDITREYTKAQKEFLYDYYMERDCKEEANAIWQDE